MENVTSQSGTRCTEPSFIPHTITQSQKQQQQQQQQQQQHTHKHTAHKMGSTLLGRRTHQRRPLVGKSMDDGNSVCTASTGNNSCITTETMSGKRSRVARQAAAAVRRYRMRVDQTPSMSLHDLTIGKCLGHGGYCDVYEVQTRSVGSTATPDSLALKRARQVDAAVDLVTEAALLTHLQHENIIRLYGMAAGPIEDSVTSREGFFLVLEKIETTLDERIQEWKTAVTTKNGSKNQSCRDQQQERLSVALQLANAVAHLHRHGIVHRDLKPQNVGFDKNNVLKLFDFGTAARKVPYGALTGVVGTRPYMAPEVMDYHAHGPDDKHRCLHYDESVDVYSFGVLLWEMLSLDRPFDSPVKEHPHMYRQELERRVVNKNERPPVPAAWSRQMKKLLRQCWHASPSKRPSMDDVVKMIERMME